MSLLKNESNLNQTIDYHPRGHCQSLSSAKLVFNFEPAKFDIFKAETGFHTKLSRQKLFSNFSSYKL